MERAIEYLNQATNLLTAQISTELDESKKEVIKIIDINKTKMIAQIQRGKSREIGSTGSGKRLKKNKHTRRYKKKRGRKTRNNRR